LAIGRKQMMQRIDTRNGAAEARRRFAEAGQRLEIADPRVAMVPQGVEVGGQAEKPATARDRFVEEAGLRAHDEAAFLVREVLEDGGVITGRKRGKRDGQMTHGLAADRDAAKLPEFSARELQP